MTTVYVGGEQHLLVCKLSENQLGIVERLDVGAVPSFLAFAKRRGMLYAVNEGADRVVAVRLGQDGSHEVLGSVPSPGGPAYVAVDRNERFVLAANYGGGTVLVWPIQGDGSLGPATDELRTGVNPHAILTDPTNHFVFVPNKGSDRVTQLKFDPSLGKLRPSEPEVVTTNAGAGPRHLAFHPSGKRAYLVNELDCTIITYALDGGRLRLLQIQPTLPRSVGPDDTGADVHVSADGRFVYSSNRGHDSIAIWRTTPEGLELVGHESTRGRVPRNFCLLGDDRLLVANQESHTLVGFERDRETGLLRHLFETEVGERAFWVGTEDSVGGA
jgi:6-phosphogluconolactonase